MAGLKTYYLLDSENIGVNTLVTSELFKMAKGDELIIFYSKDECLLNLEAYTEFCKNCDVQLMKVTSGTKNALDFQLSSYLGKLIEQNKNKNGLRYYIISKDKGYEVLSTFWRQYGENVQRKAYINEPGGNKE